MKFEFSIVGYPGPFFHLEKKGNQLHCRETPKYADEHSDSTITIKENEQWNELVQFLETRKWKGFYETPGICDGTGWEFSFQTNKKELQCSGNNAFPPGFHKFLRKLNKVTDEEGIFVY